MISQLLRNIPMIAICASGGIRWHAQNPPKRKAPAKPVGRRSGKVAVLVRLPPALVAEIDAIAAADRRARSTMVEMMLVEAVRPIGSRTTA